MESPVANSSPPKDAYDTHLPDRGDQGFHKGHDGSIDLESGSDQHLLQMPVTDSKPTEMGTPFICYDCGHRTPDWVMYSLHKRIGCRRRSNVHGSQKASNDTLKLGRDNGQHLRERHVT